ncbi:MAG TPA: hypothetical protein DHW61_14980 [Lachnoclostridium phytofermentans]|uniref:Glycosyl hydrolase family 13 catalytic domain-containing protein n=1 Tax=Lachnoclostridium phytofermentans TaxID=66219 RepID=A0A3D2XAQ6_9FIRM|nr:alpha-amylase family glycosyl hydrolase [Lachnoclostridium sp.]HCL03683.1 hypothetical protein [Lachnoclostridium phytofermentans]
MGRFEKPKKEEYQLPKMLGVEKQGNNLVFSVAVPNATECSLKLYSKKDVSIIRTISMQKSLRFGNIFSALVPESEASEILGYRYEAFGEEFVDPYATKILGREQYGMAPYVIGDNNDTLHGLLGSWETYDYYWGEDTPLSHAYSDLILYKLHVRGYTKSDDSKVQHKGTYKGIIEKIPYFKELGINALFLMPCVEFNERMEPKPCLSELPNATNEYHKRNSFLMYDSNLDCKLNFWGYTTDSFYFAPKSSYASSPNDASMEFKEMVEKLHENGIEVLLDMNFPREMIVQCILDCLRYWAHHYHIDGFRTNAEESIQQSFAMDSYLVGVKLFSTHWNIGAIYGRETVPNKKTFADYNDGFLIDARRFLKGDEGQIGQIMARIRENPEKSGVINYITDHNGFTLADLYSFDCKHNEANKEGNRDGTDFNYSWNCGVEGDTNRRKIKELRLQMMKNAFMLLFLSQGTPMILQGDEFGNSQDGNNNAYCQDNSIGWVSWSEKKKQNELFSFVKQLIKFRKVHPVLHNIRELSGIDILSCGCPDISYHGSKAWYPDISHSSRTLGVLLHGAFALKDKTTSDASCYIAMNAHWEEHSFALPSFHTTSEWKLALSSKEGKLFDGGGDGKESYKTSVIVPARTIQVFLCETVK